MANNRKFNKVMMSGASSQNNSTQLSPSTELERSYDPEELYASRAKAAKEKADKKAQEEAMRRLQDDEPLDKNVKLMSPTRMVLRRFFRSKLSIVGLVMIIGLFLFCFLGPLFYQVDPAVPDKSGKVEYVETTVTIEEDGQTYEIVQTIEKKLEDNFLAPMSGDHPLGTDKQGYDVLARLMSGGQVSLIVSFLAVIIITVIGVILGGIAGYFGGVIDNIIMRICDILMCLPGIPILLIVGTIIDGLHEQYPDLGLNDYRIYILMAFLSIISWTGTARLVRGQILSLREQEYMVAAEAMGYSTSRKIFKHLVPNVMPQLIVQMSLSLGSMILYEATLSYLNLGVREPQVAWGTMISIISSDMNILQNHFNVWGSAGICIVIAVLGFNFVGDGLRDALDPKLKK